MKKPFETPQSHWWDWASIFLLFTLLQTLAWRLAVTEWTPSLDFAQSFTSFGFILGAALGYSTFTHRSSRWIVFFYMLIMLPLQWTRIYEPEVGLEERLASIGGRLLFSFSEFFARRPVDDPFFFIALMSIAFWALSSSASFHLIRRQQFLASTVPAFAGILILQSYDNRDGGKIFILGFFLLIALLLLGRLNFLQDQLRWRAKRVFLSPENSIDLMGSFAIAASLLVISAWMIPASLTRIDTAKQVWERATRPWKTLTQRLENAVSALESSNVGRPGEFYGTELELGLGFPLSDTVMFSVQVPELDPSQRPPRYYWRGRTYDNFTNNQWFTTGTTSEEYTPIDTSLPIADLGANAPARFLFEVRDSGFSLVYAPAQPVWVSRPGITRTAPAGENKEITAWSVTPSLLPGEFYQVEAILKNPNIQQLREAGDDYPEWITQRYLQLPQDFSPRLSALALEVTTDADSPYDKASAITRYLRENIEYTPTVPAAPRNTDPLEWVVFEHKQAFCMYYATSEVLMLRSLGIPARLAVGFAQGTGFSPNDALPDEVEGITTGTYTVSKNNAHAWPEVYFPGIGWVEFEPTGNQAPLDRPLPPRDSNSPGNVAPIENPLLDDRLDLASREAQAADIAADPAVPTDDPFIPPLYLFLSLTIFTALTIFLIRRHSLHTRMPILLRASFERSGGEAPNWLVRWDHWSRLSPIEKAFESINSGLRQLSAPPPVNATPSERANSLISLLPQAGPQIKLLLDEHQTSLYTSRVAEVKSAQRAAFSIRTQVILAQFRYFWTGRYSLKT